MSDLIISEVLVRIDGDGRYCLNDLHKAAGGESRHQPAKWLITQQAIDLIELLKSEKRDTGILVSKQNQPLKVYKGGSSWQGTFVAKDLVYAYAMWISAAFHLKVIRAYDALVTGSIRPMTQLEFARAQVRLLEQLEETQNQLQIAIDTKAEIGSRREATAMNTASQERKRANRLEAELDRSKQYCTVKRMEMLQHGQKFNWRLLKSTGIAMGIEPIDVFNANYGTVKAYRADVWLEAYAINLADLVEGAA